MPVTPLQTSFSDGEVSKHLRGRRDSSIFQKGLDFCENFWPLPHGPLLSRGPSMDHGALPNDPGIRFAQLRMADEQDFLLAFSDHSMQVWSVATGKKEIITARDISKNGDFAQGDEDWILRSLPGYPYAFTGASEIAFGQCVLTTIKSTNGAEGFPVDYVSLQLRQELVTDGPYSGTVYVKVRTLTGGILESDPDYEVIFLRCLIETGDGAPAGLLTRVDYNRATGNGLFAIPFTMPPGATHLNINLYLVTHTPVNVPVSACRCELDDFAVVIDREEGFDIATPWTSEQLASIQWDTETAQDHTVFVHPEVTPWTLRYDGRGGGFWRWNEVEFIGPPLAWGPGHWPEAVQFHDGRLYLAIRNEIWGSRVGSPFDFRPRTDQDGNPTDVVSQETYVTPECSLQRKVATKGAIRWMQSGRVLLLGTDITEHSVTGQSGISPTDIQVKTESRFGSARKAAVDAGSHVLYVSKDRKKVRAIAYSSDSEGWDSKDLTFIGSHLTNDKIKELHHTDGLILALLDSGWFAASAYNPGEGSIGWWRLKLEGSRQQVRTAAVSNGPDGVFLWMAVDRGAGMRLERIELSENEDEIAYLDSAIDIVVNVPSGGQTPAVLTGLAHLNGEAVLITVNGKILDSEELRVVLGGQVDRISQIDGPGVFRFTVGIPYRPFARLLPKEPKGGKVHNANVGLHLSDSAIPLVNGKRPKDRTPSTRYDSPEPRRTGKAEITNLGWDGEGMIEIKADLPFRCEILAVYSTTQREEM